VINTVQYKDNAPLLKHNPLLVPNNNLENNLENNNKLNYEDSDNSQQIMDYNDLESFNNYNSDSNSDDTEHINFVNNFEPVTADFPNSIIPCLQIWTIKNNITNNNKNIRVK